MPYRPRVPYRAPEYDVDEGYYEPPANNRNTLLLFFILLLVIGWLLFNRNWSLSSIGAGWGERPVDWSASDQPVSPDEAGIRKRAADDEPRTKQPEASVTPKPRARAEATVTPERRVQEKKKEVFKPAVGYWRDPNIIGYAWITADEVHLRKGPGLDHDALYVLPENWPVAILNESDVANDGEVWAHVRVETKQGTKKGWLNRRYLSY
jgi:hypothetical protein